MAFSPDGDLMAMYDWVLTCTLKAMTPGLVLPVNGAYQNEACIREDRSTAAYTLILERVEEEY